MGAPFRVPYGYAIGFDTQFNFHRASAANATGTAGLLIQNSGTNIDVTNGTLFYTNNSVATTITTLRNSTYSSNTGTGFEGEIIRIWMLDTLTEFQNGGNIILSGTGNYGKQANASIELMYSRGNWYELGRSSPGASGGIAQSLIGSSAATLTADGVSTFVLLATAAAVTIRAISGGFNGQKVSMIMVASDGTSIGIETSGNIRMALTNAIVSGSNALHELVRWGTNWYLQRGGVPATGG
jgi:hypothetical protein